MKRTGRPRPKRNPTTEVKKPHRAGTIGLDTETTGTDLRHGARPFMVIISHEGEIINWEWDVDPVTRVPIMVASDVAEIREYIDNFYLVLQNPKFDVTALASANIHPTGGEWHWEDTYDTLLLSHLLASNQPHDLTTLAMIYLGINIKPHEDRMEHAVKECRNWARTHRPEWRLAKKDDPDMPSARDKAWKYDMWLPRAVAIDQDFPDDHPYWQVTTEYANADAAVMIPLFEAMMEECHKRGLTEIYHSRMQVLPVAYKMEQRGITGSIQRLEELDARFEREADACHRKCIHLADGELDKLPVSGASNALRSVIFDKFQLRSPNTTEKGNPSLDKAVLDFWQETLPRNKKPYLFIKNLRNYRRRMTGRSYMAGYRRFWHEVEPGYFRLHPSLNPTGSDTLRWSCKHPNEQNISKQEEPCPDCNRKGCDNCLGTGIISYNLRHCFGPLPGREWWSMDAKNIELRIPAYASGERALIELFESPDDPPYYGSTHLLNFHTVYPDIWDKELAEVGIEKVGPHCKKKYASTWYQWCKNGGFAVQYGAIEKADGTGTADRAFHRPGSHARLKSRFARLTELNQKCIQHAREHGYVCTLPDKEVDPKQGYPLLCTRSKWGKILETVPLNYFTQGSAMWWMCRAMVKCQQVLDRWNEGWNPQEQSYLIMQVHDELVFDLPHRLNKAEEDPKLRYGNYQLIQDLRGAMESCGTAIGIPTPVSSEYHEHTWAEGVTVT